MALFLGYLQDQLHNKNSSSEFEKQVQQKQTETPVALPPSLPAAHPDRATGGGNEQFAVRAVDDAGHRARHRTLQSARRAAAIKITRRQFEKRPCQKPADGRRGCSAKSGVSRLSRNGMATLSFFCLLISAVCSLASGCIRREPPADVTIINDAEPETLDPAIITGHAGISHRHRPV